MLEIKNICFSVDENGERIYYAKSPYYVTNNINEKKYLLDAGSCYGICAIKKDGDFINLISGQKINNIREEIGLKIQFLFLLTLI